MAKETEGIVKPVSSHTNVWSEKQEEEPEANIAKKIDEIVNLFSPILKYGQNNKKNLK